MVSVGRDCGSEQCWRGLHVQGWGGSASRISLTTFFLGSVKGLAARTMAEAPVLACDVHLLQSACVSVKSSYLQLQIFGRGACDTAAKVQGLDSISIDVLNHSRISGAQHACAHRQSLPVQRLSGRSLMSDGCCSSLAASLLRQRGMRCAMQADTAAMAGKLCMQIWPSGQQ